VRKEDADKEAKDLARLESVRAKEIKEAAHSQDKSLVELRHKCERLEADVAAKTKQCHALEKDLTAAHHKIAELEKHLEDERKTVSSSKATIVHLQKEHDALLAAKEHEFAHIVEKSTFFPKMQLT